MGRCGSRKCDFFFNRLGSKRVGRSYLDLSTGRDSSGNKKDLLFI